NKRRQLAGFSFSSFCRPFTAQNSASPESLNSLTVCFANDQLITWLRITREGQKNNCQEKNKLFHVITYLRMTCNLPIAATSYSGAPSSVPKTGTRLYGTGRLHSGWIKRPGFLLAAALAASASLTACQQQHRRHVVLAVLLGVAITSGAYLLY
ncbi:MAG: hypothetical protein ACRYG7_21230, partial [Janthinobacterium lividum]